MQFHGSDDDVFRSHVCCDTLRTTLRSDLDLFQSNFKPRQLLDRELHGMGLKEKETSHHTSCSQGFAAQAPIFTIFSRSLAHCSPAAGPIFCCTQHFPRGFSVRLSSAQLVTFERFGVGSPRPRTHWTTYPFPEGRPGTWLTQANKKLKLGCERLCCTWNNEPCVPVQTLDGK